MFLQHGRKNMTKYNVGDKVILVDDEGILEEVGLSPYHKREIATIIGFNSKGYLYESKQGKGLVWHCTDKQIKKYFYKTWKERYEK